MTLSSSIAVAGSPMEGWNGVTAPSRRGRSSRRIGEVIVDLGFAEPAVVDDAVAEARATGRTTGQVLLERGALSADDLARALAERYGLDHVDLGLFTADTGAAALLGTDVARRYSALPIAFVDSRMLLVAMADPGNIMALDDIVMMTGYEVQRAVASDEDITALINRLDHADAPVSDEILEEDEEPVDLADLRSSASDAPVVKFVHSIIADGVDRGASDIHFDPSAGGMQVRMRVDGLVTDTATIPRRMVPSVVSRIKIMAEMSISERRVPQDGRIGLMIDGRPVDVRVVTLPTAGGESVVMRILDKAGVMVEFDKLGLSERDNSVLGRAISKINGTLLVTGPTGSGKTTTLYAALSAINSLEKTLITIEDPVEYQLAGVKQVQVNPQVGLTFAAGLRAMLRADPHLLMVGEIRDRETAQLAIEAGLTGHLVLSTLHTNDAATAVTRLVEMGIEPFLVASALDTVVAQRLVRRLCRYCKRPVTLADDFLEHNGYPPFDEEVETFEAVGCPRCAGTGYKGRLALFEVMPLSEEIRALAVERAGAKAIAATAREQGMRPIRDDGIRKIRGGLTSVSEVLRVAGSH